MNASPIYYVVSRNAITGKRFEWQFAEKEYALEKAAEILNGSINKDKHIKVKVYSQLSNQLPRDVEIPQLVNAKETK